MKNQGRTGLFVGTLVSLTLFAGLLAFTLAGKISTSAKAQTQPTSATADGLRVVTFDTPSARVTIKLPDEIRTGDTVSGTLVTEPKGATDDERAKNRAAVRSRIIRLMLTRARRPDAAPTVTPGQSEPVTLTVPLSGVDTSTIQTSPGGQENITRIEFKAAAPADNSAMADAAKSSEAELGSAVVPIDTDPAPDAGPKPAAKFTVPPLGQTGRPVVVTGPFDGKGSNTDVKMTAPSKPFIKTSTRQEGVDLPVIAESPRKAVLEFPQDIVGPARIAVTDESTQTSAPFRNLRIDLTAPKTRLLKGEKTTMTVQVSGLQGLKTPAPMTLTCTGVVTMEGGAYQRIIIEPSQVTSNGTYTTTRDITGVQAGGWGAAATVVAGRFNMSLQDDSDPATVILWNTVTGDYRFANPRAALTGTGKVEVKGCVITLSHNAADRRVFARLDACTKSGDATTETVTPKGKFTITDGNTADNTAPFQ